MDVPGFGCGRRGGDGDEPKRVRVEGPTEVDAGTAHTWILEVTAGPEGFPPGSRLAVAVEHGADWGLDYDEAGSATNRFGGLRVDADRPGEWRIQRETVSSAGNAAELQNVDAPLQPGDRVRIHVGDPGIRRPGFPCPPPPWPTRPPSACSSTWETSAPRTATCCTAPSRPHPPSPCCPGRPARCRCWPPRRRGPARRRGWCCAWRTPTATPARLAPDRRPRRRSTTTPRTRSCGVATSANRAGGCDRRRCPSTSPATTACGPRSHPWGSPHTAGRWRCRSTRAPRRCAGVRSTATAWSPTGWAPRTSGTPTPGQYASTRTSSTFQYQAQVSASS
jgi:hypothetical protein